MDWLNEYTQTPALEILLRFGLAALFGMVLGIDRELRGKAAGLRTHMLISVGAAATTIVGFELYYTANAIDERTRSDLLRIIEGVMAGIGFLGAGAIVSRDRYAHNMTTAANIWVCGAIGIACGAGYYVVAAIALGFTILILTVLGLVERVIKRAID